MDLLEEQLSYKFRNPELLQQALTYSTFPTPTSSPFNTRKRTCDHLKLLGDAVIKLLTSQYAICVSLPNDKVHKIVRIKDNISNRYIQNTIGKTLQLEEKGIVVTNLQHDQFFSHLDTFVKSLFGAIFIDAGGSEKKGFISCWKVFLRLWKPVIASYDGAKPLIACFPEPTYSSQEFLKERFSNYKTVDLGLLEDKIGFKFLKQPHLLEQAMTHDSIEHFRNAVNSPDPRCPEFVHFQTLEFLGDSVLELVIMEYLYLRSSSADPLGQMLFFNRDTGQKLVSSRFQIQVANKLKLEEFVIKPPQAIKASYEDFVESLIGSIYIHAKAIGLRACAKIVLEMWGLEPSLEEEEDAQSEDKKHSVPEDPVANKENLEKGVEVPVKKAEMTAPPPPAASTSSFAKVSTSSPTPLVVRDPSSHEELQAMLDYKFVNAHLLKYLPPKIDVSTADARATSLNVICISKNLQTIGKRAIELTIAEYVIGICHSSKTADLSAEMKGSVTKLMQDLSGDELLSDIFSRLKLSKFFNLLQEEKVPNPITSTSEALHLILGAVFVDSSGDLQKIQKLFLRLWHSYTNGAKPETCVVNWFPDTSEKQKIFRAAVNAKISDAMWTKMALLLGHTFTHKNLLEQALTDEKSQGYGKQCHDAYPLGNPFALQILGKRVIALFIAQTSYLNTLAEPGNFSNVIERFDQSLFNTLKSRFHNLERCYANHIRYPFPPKKNPRAPYEAMLAALYLDVGGGMRGLQQVHCAIAKASPTLLTLKKAKGVNTVVATSESTQEERSVSVSTEGGSDEAAEGNTKSTEMLPNSPLKSNKNVQEVLNTSFGSQESGGESGGRSTPWSPPPVGQDPLLFELQKKMGYKFVNPLLLKIVLEVDIALPVGGGEGNSQITSKNHFEIFKILGRRAINLLVTEFALESVPMSKTADISEMGKKQVETHMKHLTSAHVLVMVSSSLELNKYVFTAAQKDNGAPSNEDFIMALLGAVFIDSRANYLKILALFNKLWKSNATPVEAKPRIAQCFLNTSEAQLKLRSALCVFHTDCKWRKVYRKLSYEFKTRNLLEQALTDEKSQELARTKHDAYPTGNPFALRLLGRCVIELVIAYKTLPSDLNTQAATYVAGLNLFEKSLFNSFKNNFLGTEKYYACVKQKKNQPFPPKDNPLGPYEAIMGAVFIDSGAGNPGLDTVGVVIVHRNIGLKGNKPNIGILEAASVPIAVTLGPSSPLPVYEPIPPVASSTVTCSTPAPSTSSALSESLNTSFSSKCAANFSISPAQPRKSPIPTKPMTPTPTSTPAPAPSEPKPKTPPASPQKKPQTSPSKSKSPKKQQKQKSYASALINGQPVKTDNKLIIAVTNAQSQIQALKKKQESKDHHRKISMEREKLQLQTQQQQQQQDQDQVSNASSGGRSGCPSTSTITSVGSQQPKSNQPGQKRKRSKNASKKQQNKKAKSAVTPQPAKKVVVTPQHIMQQRVANWCQNQLDGMPSTSSSSLPGGEPSSCTSTTEVHQQRSMVHLQQQSSDAGRGDVEIVEDNISSQFSSPTHSTYNTHVPVNMVCGYRKSAVDDYNGHGITSAGATFSKGKSTPQKKGEMTTRSHEEGAAAADHPSGGFSYLGILKWTSLILGVAFLLRRYSRGK